MPKAALMWPPVKDCTPGQKRRLKMGEDTPKTGLRACVGGLITTLQLDGYHTAFSIRSSMRGYPDYTIWGPGGLIFRELKGDGYEPTDEQWAVIYRLRAAGEDAGWWNPDDWYSKRVERELKALRRPAAPVAAIRRQDIHTELDQLVEVARAAIGAGPTYGGVRIELDSLKTVLAGYVDELVERAEVGHRRTGNPAHGDPR